IKHKEEDVDERVHTLLDYELTDDEKILDEEIIYEEEEDEVTKELYDDVNVNLGNEDTEMTNANQVDCYMDKKLREVINKAIQAHNFNCREEDQAEKKEYIELVNSMSSYEAVATLSKFKLTNILIDKMEKNKSFHVVDYKRELYDALIKSYNTKKDIFESYGEVFSLKRSRDDKDKDQDPSTRSDRGTKGRKSSKHAESSRDS
nr:hypothetical protein [Tanacetum cinerariifolium]